MANHRSERSDILSGGQNGSVFQDRQARFLQAVGADFLVTPTPLTPLRHQLLSLTLPMEYATWSRQEMIRAMMSCRFQYVPYYFQGDFEGAVEAALNELPLFLLQLLYHRGLRIVLDVISMDSGLFRIDNRTIMLCERFVIDDTIIKTEANRYIPGGLLEVIVHEVGHFLDWYLTQEGDKLSSDPRFFAAWQEEKQHIPDHYNITFEEGQALCKQYGGYVFMPQEEKRRVDFQGFIEVDQEIFAESFLFLMLGTANEEVMAFFPKTREAALTILQETFQSIATYPAYYLGEQSLECMELAEEYPTEENSDESHPGSLSDEESAAGPGLDRYVIADSSVMNREAGVGGKAKSLAILHHAGIPVPRWFVVTPEAFYDSLSEAQWEAWQQAETDEAYREIVASVCMNEAIEQHLQTYIEALCPHGEVLALRSSGAQEDGEGQSFAGMFDSYLCVAPEAVVATILAVWQSGFSQRVLQYREDHAIAGVPDVPAVIVQHMVSPEVSGVAFGANPLTGEAGETVISAVMGLGSVLVGGEVNGDTVYVDSAGQLIQHDIGYQHVAVKIVSNTLVEELLPQGVADSAKLSGEQALVIAEWVQHLGTLMGDPQDVEWAIAEGELFFLQSRPITTLKKNTLSREPVPQGETDISGLNSASGVFQPVVFQEVSCRHVVEQAPHYQYFLNSLIVESLSGFTLPLTYSIQRKFYGAFYREFLFETAVVDPALKMRLDLFDNLLGLIRGRAYINWTAIEKLWASAGSLREVGQVLREKGGQRSPQSEQWNWGIWLKSVAAVFQRYCTTPDRIRRFQAQVSRVTALPLAECRMLSVWQLLDRFREVMRVHEHHWQAPAFSDYLAGVFFNGLQSLCETWCGDQSLAQELIARQQATLSGSISSQLHANLVSMAHVAKGNTPLVAALSGGDVAAVQEQIRLDTAFEEALQDYLEKFGDRCQEDSKLEVPSTQEDPLPLFRSIGVLAAKLSQPAPDQPLAGNTDHSVVPLLASQPLWRRWVLRWVTQEAAVRIQQKEDLRFEYSRLMAHLRGLFRILGEQWAAQGILTDPMDIHYLSDDEIVGYAEGTLIESALQSWVTHRKGAYAQYALGPDPGSAFYMQGLVAEGDLVYCQTEDTTESTGMFQGKGSCAGVVIGQVCWVRPGMDPQALSGKLLAAVHSDPGLITYYPLVRGLLFEYGSPLSHSAIVARELGLPTVVSLRGLPAVLQDGDWVEMDGRTGRVQIISPPMHLE